MKGYKDLLLKILANEKIKKMTASETVYRDEPILISAAQMKNYMPPKYREMKKIAKSHEAYRHSYEWVFYQQAKFMEDFEDDYDYHGNFLRYYPTYQVMNDFQLRGYFAWRTKVRRGQVEETSLSFVFLYIYELLNQVGVTDPVDGFEKLRTLWDAYKNYDTSVNHYMKIWMVDYAAYYGLDPTLLRGEMFGDTEHLKILQNYKDYDTDALFEAICAFSSYNIEKSKLFKAYPQDVREIICRVYAAESAYADKHRKTGYFEKLFGKPITASHPMFATAVFYRQKNFTRYEYRIHDFLSYSCINNQWKCTQLPKPPKKNTQLGTLVKATDCMMRKAYGFTPPLKEVETTKLLKTTIEKEILALLEEKKQAEKREIVIDLSKLDDIRSAAAQTREKLLTEDEREDIPPSDENRETRPTGAATPTAPQQNAQENFDALTDAEMLLLRCLLYGGDHREAMQKLHLMPSLVCESVNEKLFDRFGDTVIDFCADEPKLIEDYTEELKGLILP